MYKYYSYILINFYSFRFFEWYTVVFFKINLKISFNNLLLKKLNYYNHFSKMIKNVLH